MKIWFYLSLNLLVFLAYGQDFLSDNAVWHYTNPDGHGNPFVKCAVYEYARDTTINDKPCNVIVSNYYDNIYLHIDSGNVYYYKYDRFNLLYAFNISEGDTIDLVVRCTGFFYDEEESLVGFDSVFTMESVVQEVDSIYLSDRYIKYVTVHFITEHEILENSIYPGSFTYFMKFGHLDDGFIPIAVKAIGPDIDSQRRLRCFTDDEYSGKGIPVQEDLSDCDILLGVKEVPPDDLIDPVPDNHTAAHEIPWITPRFEKPSWRKRS